MREYAHKKIEKKWQKVWKQTGLYKTRKLGTAFSARQGLSLPADLPVPTRQTGWQAGIKPARLNGSSRSGGDSKFYILDMFPYPSGEGLHVGHPKGYIATDVVSRMKRMQGHAVLHPMGFDAFGLPAENYAIKTKTNPETAVKKNVARYKKQLELLGFDYDWSREINTTDPNYYKWTQWIFLKMFEKGLAYQSYEPINWCPSCKTGLANEDVEDGKCERCGTAVEKKPMRQWVLKITDYAERLLKDIETVEWPENIKEQQRNWIGKSEGALIKFQITSTKSQINSKFQIPNSESGEIEVFTTRADTLYGVTYLVLAPEVANVKLKNQNEKLQFKIQNWEEVEKYIKQTKKKTEIERTAEGKEKTGVELKGIKAVNPANGEEIPVWVADYVLPDYGTGAIMAVPAHDERDFLFAKKYGLPIKMVVCPNYPAPTCLILDQAYLGAGHLVGSGKFDGMESREAAKAITEFVGGEMVTKYKLRDWVFSRQRYWGEPIPLVFCEECKKRVESSKLNATRYTLPARRSIGAGGNAGEAMNPGWVAVPEKDLPVKLPKVKYYEPTGTGESPLASIDKWVNVKCPRCGGKACRETNTMPQWAGSSWYHLAYISKRTNRYTLPARRSRFGAGGTAQRLLAKWLPVDLYVGGAEHATRHLIYARFWHKFLQDIGIVSVPEPFMKLRPVGLIMGEDGRKMSKRFGNVINPDEIVARFGADSLRVYEMFMGPFDQQIAWSTDSLVGARRFLERVWRLREKAQSTVHKVQTKHKAQSTKLESLLHQTIRKVGEDVLAFKFNTAVSALMILLNAFEKESSLTKGSYETFVQLLAPFAPHLSEELWEELGYRKSVHIAPWPAYDERLLDEAPVTIVVQVDGRTRGSFSAARGEPKETLKAQALGLQVVQKWLQGGEIRTVIVVPDRLVNVVTEPSRGA